jgi:hypothetical protein
LAARGSQNPGDYRGLLVTEGFAQAAQSFVQVYEMLVADGYPGLAGELRRAWVRFDGDVKLIARDTAAFAFKAIKEEEKKTRVRPDTNGDGGRRMEDFLGISAPLDAVPGSVGVNYEPALYANVPWWWTNEEGYSGHVGRVVHGMFYDAGWTGASAPNPGLSQVHPLFRAEGPQRPDNALGPVTQRQKTFPMSGGKGVRPGMLIKNPIPARRFVEKGYAMAESKWHADMRVAKARFDAAVGRVAAKIAPKPARP